ncbi:MAG: phage protein GemA/Gp16 family protein [Kiritimatiellales bacterium]
MKTIDAAQRKRIFCLVREAHAASSSSLPIESWRKQIQLDEGIESLSSCPAEKGLKLMNRLHRFIEECRLPIADRGQRSEVGSQRSEVGGRKSAVGNQRKRGPAKGRPKGILEWCGEQKAQLEKVEALCADMGLPWDYADDIAKRMFGNSVLRVDTLNKKQLTAVIAALVKRQRKFGGREYGPGTKDVQRDLF